MISRIALLLSVLLMACVHTAARDLRTLDTRYLMADSVINQSVVNIAMPSHDSRRITLEMSIRQLSAQPLQLQLAWKDHLSHSFSIEAIVDSKQSDAMLGANETSAYRIACDGRTISSGRSGGENDRVTIVLESADSATNIMINDMNVAGMKGGEPVDSLLLTIGDKAMIEYIVMESELSPMQWTVATDGPDSTGAIGNMPCGLWRHLDRDHDERMARPGGEYTLLVRPSATVGYDIVYQSGARVNSNFWHRGMLKGHLLESAVAGQYDLLWFDAAGLPLTNAEPLPADVTASADRWPHNSGYAVLSPGNPSVLTLTFPLLKSTIRYTLTNPETAER